MPGGVLSFNTVTVPAAFSTTQACFAASFIDKVDITPSSGDVLMQVLTPNNDWQPPAGRILRAGIARSIAGLTVIYPPGPTMVRFALANPTVPATIDVDISVPS